MNMTRVAKGSMASFCKRSKEPGSVRAGNSLTNCTTINCCIMQLVSELMKCLQSLPRMIQNTILDLYLLKVFSIE
jgi:hypothetical protein